MTVKGGCMWAENAEYGALLRDSLCHYPLPPSEILNIASLYEPLRAKNGHIPYKVKMSRT